MYTLWPPTGTGNVSHKTSNPRLVHERIAHTHTFQCMHAASHLAIQSEVTHGNVERIAKTIISKRECLFSQVHVHVSTRARILTGNRPGIHARIILFIDPYMHVAHTNGVAGQCTFRPISNAEAIEQD